MAINLRNVANEVLPNLVAAFNAFKREFVGSSTSYPHADITSTTSGPSGARVATPILMVTPTATNLATVIAKTNEAIDVLAIHAADDVGHVDSASPMSVTRATDQASANAALNIIKAWVNFHALDTAAHFTADETNVVTASTATDLATSEALANDIHDVVNAHIQAAFPTASLKLVSP